MEARDTQPLQNSEKRVIKDALYPTRTLSEHSKREHCPDEERFFEIKNISYGR